MHTLDVKIDGYEYVYVHHNSDWSGDARIVYRHEGERVEYSATLPGELLIKLGGQVAFKHMKTTVIDWLENQELMNTADGIILDLGCDMGRKKRRKRK